MSIDNDFYVSLPSNVDNKLFPRNSNGHYKTQLEHELHLESGKWEVGLAEFHYTKSFHNIKGGGVAFYEHDEALSSSAGVKPGKGVFLRRLLEVPAAHYRSLADMVNALSSLLQGSALEGAFSVRINYNRRATVVYNPSPQVRRRVRRVKLYGDFSRALGFGALFPLTPGAMKKGPMAADVNRGMTGLFIYTNVVDRHLVGDSFVPLLRVVPVRRSDSPFENVAIEFSNVQYHEVGNFHGREIEVQVRRDTGKTVNFNAGKVLVVLHFRKTRRALEQSV